MRSLHPFGLRGWLLDDFAVDPGPARRRTRVSGSRCGRRSLLAGPPGPSPGKAPIRFRLQCAGGGGSVQVDALRRARATVALHRRAKRSEPGVTGNALGRPFERRVGRTRGRLLLSARFALGGRARLVRPGAVSSRVSGRPCPTTKGFVRAPASDPRLFALHGRGRRRLHGSLFDRHPGQFPRRAQGALCREAGMDAPHAAGRKEGNQSRARSRSRDRSAGLVSQWLGDRAVEARATSGWCFRSTCRGR